MKPTGQDPPVAKSKSKLFLIIALVFFFVMAVVWSLDDSFVYLTFGLASYFLFLAYSKKPREVAKFHQTHEHHQQKRTPTDDFLDELERSFSKKKKQAQQSTSASVSSKIAGAASIFIVGVFFFIFVIVLFFSDDQSAGEVSFLDRAEQFRDNGDYDSAKIYYRQALREEPDDALIVFSYGNVFLSEENYDSALYYYDRSLALQETFDDARYNKGLVRYYQKRYDLTRQEMKRILSGNTEYYDATLLLGDSFYTQNEYDSAIYWYEKGYEGGIRTAALCNVMAYIYDVKNKPGQAIALYKETLQYDSARVEVYTRLAELVPDQAQMYSTLQKRYSSQ
jgi:tetratricopeptide (TPR) repeat protein